MARLAVFGSAACDTDFDQQTSDADLLLEFDPDSGLAPFDQFFDLAEALSMTLGRLLERLARGGYLIITRHGKPVAQLIPVTADRQQAQQAAAPPQESALGGTYGHHSRRAPVLTPIVVDNSAFLAWCQTPRGT